MEQTLGVINCSHCKFWKTKSRLLIWGICINPKVKKSIEYQCENTYRSDPLIMSFDFGCIWGSK